MTDQPFRVSKDSIEISYRRFLADSAAGFLLIALMGAAYYFPLLTRSPLKQLYGPAGVGPEVKVFFLVVAFLLATPIGFAVNALSWFILTQPLDFVERFAARHATLPASMFPLSDIAASRHIGSLSRRFGLDDENFAEQVSFLRQAIESPPLVRFAPEMQARGLLIFIRNTCLFLLIMGFISLAVASQHLWQIVALLSGAWLTVSVLVMPWHKRKLACKIVALLAFITVIAAAAVPEDPRLAVQGIVMILVSAACATLAGIIGFYNSCLVLLYAYFAEISIGNEEDLAESAPPSLKKVTSMIQAARNAAVTTASWSAPTKTEG